VVLRGIIGQSALNAIAMGAGYLATVYIARMLGKEAFGALALAQSYIVIVTLFVDMGLPTYGSRQVAKAGENKGLLIQITRFRVGIASTITIAVGILCEFASPSWPGPDWRLMFLATLWLVPWAMNTDWYHAGMHRFGLASGSRVLQQVLYLGIAVLTTRSADDVALPLVARAVSGLVTALVLYRGLAGLSVYGKLSTAHLFASGWSAGGIFFSLSVLNVVFSNAAILALGYLTPVAEVGIYMAAFNVASLFTSVVSLVHGSVFPIMAKLHAEDETRFAAVAGNYRLMLTIFGGGIALSSLFVSSNLVAAIFGQEYANGTNCLKILLMGSGIHVINGGFVQPMLAKGHEARVLAALACATIATVLALLFVVKLHGATGAAAVYTGGIALATVAVIFLGRQNTFILGR
jgi:polysaccharide transporter, PST family